ncbi:MAG: ATP-binding protein [Balneolales bacterium]
MIYKSFRINTAIRIILLSASIFLFFYVIYETGLIATASIFGIHIIFQVVALMNYVDKTNRSLASFFQAIRYDDFSQSFPPGSGGSLQELHDALGEVINHFKKTRAEKEEHYHYLQTVVQHVGVGLISYRKNGNIDLINTAAKRLLNVSGPKNISSLDDFSPALTSAMKTIKTGERTLVKAQQESEILQLVIHATEFKKSGEAYTLVSLQDIQGELEEKEMEAWLNLIRVLTHEIMNSITPISSLAATADGILKDQKNSNGDGYEDIGEALQTIHERSRGLISFVENYRELGRIPKPDYEIIELRHHFSRIKRLFFDELKEQNIELLCEVNPDTLELTADPKLVEQICINLIKNAIHAVEEKPDGTIHLKGRMDERGRVMVDIIDNGHGIPDHVKPNIFVPFFTTKEEGSGIGLSLSRQIMRAHGGALQVQSNPGEQTVFTLRFG